MRITLTHRGNIPGNKRPAAKIDAIRQGFHAQLNKLWGRDQIAFLKEWLDSGFAAGAPDYRRVVGGRTYLPIVSEKIEARANLTVTLMSGLDARRPAFTNGDVDNRVKSLIDALAAPIQPSRIPRTAPSRDTICLLSDDSLVAELTVRTAALLSENDPTITLAIIEADIVPGRGVLLKTLGMMV
ncbi:hypothetical protein BH10PSE9_BH10PSE9_03330 [soil metagenome]